MKKFFSLALYYAIIILCFFMVACTHYGRGR